MTKEKLCIGITGQAGFVGSHLYNSLGLYPEKFERIPFLDEYFSDPTALEDFVKQCDVIVHLAALNRHHDPEAIYRTNIQLVQQLIQACQQTRSTPHIVFSSSTQEERDNVYGKSKREGRILLEQWAQSQGASFTGLIIPNVFGPFGNPYYNSVVATFCHQLTHGEVPVIDVDGEIRLIYVGELVQAILAEIEKGGAKTPVEISSTASIRVSALLEKLQGFKNSYFEKGEIPSLSDAFERNLFNTFLCYIDHDRFFPFLLKKNADNRGVFVETAKLNSGGQVSFSTTVPGITRGNHYHLRKAERFAVISGKARIEFRRIGSDTIHQFDLDGENPSFVDMPIWHTHNITNTGNEELLTIFWISEHFRPEDPDTFFESV